jgi:hypothetical protein
LTHLAESKAPVRATDAFSSGEITGVWQGHPVQCTGTALLMRAINKYTLNEGVLYKDDMVNMPPTGYEALRVISHHPFF